MNMYVHIHTHTYICSKDVFHWKNIIHSKLHCPFNYNAPIEQALSKEHILSKKKLFKQPIPLQRCWFRLRKNTFHCKHVFFWKIIFDLPSQWLSKKHAAPPEQTLTPPAKEKVRDVGMLHVTYFGPAIYITHMYVSEYVCVPQKKRYVTSGCAMSRICIYLCIYI